MLKKNYQTTFLIIINLYIINLIFNWDNIINYNYTNNNINFFKKTIYNINWYNNINKIFIIDKITIIFLIITIILFIISWEINIEEFKKDNKLFFLIIIMLFSLIFCFLTINLFIFYLFFEILTIPTFFMLYFFAKHYTKLKAALLFLIYSFSSSVFLAFAIYIQLKLNNNFYNFNSNILLNSNFYNTLENIGLLFIFLGLAIKIPLVPFHVWLPEAHAESPTAISIILAGVILKVGSYGIIRFVTVLPTINNYLNYLYIYCLIGGIIAAIICLKKNNFKQLIAYMSIAHMSIGTIGLISINIKYEFFLGGMFATIQHSIMSAIFFILAGNIYLNYHTYELNILKKNIKNLKKITSILFVCFIINLELPLTGGFIGEFNIFYGIFNYNIYLTLIIFIFSIITTFYTIWILASITSSNIIINNNYFNINNYIDKKYFYINYIYMLISLNFIIGIKPHYFFY